MTTTVTPPSISVIRDGRLTNVPVRMDLTGGPDLARLSLWLLDHSNHHLMRFQAGQKALQVRITGLQPEDGSESTWIIRGVLDRIKNLDVELHVLLMYNVKSLKGHIVVSLTQPQF
jgi:hypothetical protein